MLSSFRRSLTLLGRRFGGILLLLVLFIAASVGLAVVFFPVSLVLDLAMGGSLARQLTADAVVTVLQSAVSATVAVALSASMVALVRGER